MGMIISMKKLSFMVSFVVSTTALAMQVGTNEVDFVLSQTGANAGEEIALRQEINRIVSPSSGFALFYDGGEGCIAFDSYSLPPPLFQENPFEIGHWASNRFEIPVVASFASNLMERFLFCDSHSSEVAAADTFRLNLAQAFSETNGIAFIATNFVSKKFGSNSIPLDAATNIWTSWRSWTSHPIPRSCFIRRDVGPGGTNHLWSFIPMQTSSSVFWLPIIYVDDRWNISMWDYEEQGYSWE